MTIKNTITASVIVAGASALGSQIIFVRELLVVFYGNEISIALMLASWLIWGALGSALLGRTADLIRARVTVLGVCHASLALLLPAVLFMIRSSRIFLGTVPGEIIGYTPMFVCCLTVFFIPCTLMGFMFALSCRVYSSIDGKEGARAVTRVYVLEAVGALSAGIFVSVFFRMRVPPDSAVFIFSALNALVCCAVLLYGEKFHKAARLLGAVFAVYVLASAVFVGPLLRDISLNRLWRGFVVLDSRDSVYGNITATDRAGQRSFFDNGLHLYTVPDALNAEDCAHMTLLQVKSPEKVLMIGGGMGGALREALKHPVKDVLYIELDPSVIEMGREHLGSKYTDVLSDERVRVRNVDGRLFVKNTREKFDAIIVNVGDPYTAQINRFYTRGFFKEAEKALNNDGVLSFSLTASENYLGGELRRLLRSIYLSASDIFRDSIILYGDSARFIFSRAENVLARDPDVLERRLESRGIKEYYVKDYLIPGRMYPERMAYAESMIKEGPEIRLNRDFRPISYYYAAVFWGTQFGSSFLQRVISGTKTYHIWIFFILVCWLLAKLVFKSRAGRSRRAVFIAIATTGASEMIFQLLVILAFQVIYGYVYYRLAVIMSSFMVGLALGGALIARTNWTLTRNFRAFIAVQGAVVIYPLILPVLFFFFYRHSGGGLVSTLAVDFVFPFLPAIAGFIGGIQYPLANRVCLRGVRFAGRIAGLTYGLDLLGACLAAFCAAVFLVPILGLFQTCVMVAILNFVIMILLLSAGLVYYIKR